MCDCCKHEFARNIRNSPPDLLQKVVRKITRMMSVNHSEGQHLGLINILLFCLFFIIVFLFLLFFIIQLKVCLLCLTVELLFFFTGLLSASPRAVDYMLSMCKI